MPGCPPLARRAAHAGEQTAPKYDPAAIPEGPTGLGKGTGRMEESEAEFCPQDAGPDDRQLQGMKKHNHRKSDPPAKPVGLHMRL